MVVQNFKSKNTLESNVFLHVPDEDPAATTTRNRKNLEKKCYGFFKSAIGLLCLFLLIMNISFMFVMIRKNAAINKLTKQVEALEEDVHKIKYRFIDDNLLKEIAEFEKDSYADAPQPNSDEDDYYLDDEEFNQLDNDENNRKKREVLSASTTLDGVPIIQESYADMKRKNTSYSTNVSEGLRLYESLGKNTAPPTKQHTSGWAVRTYTHHKRPGVRPTAIVSRTSRVMHTDEDKSKAFRKIIKKSLAKSSNFQEHVESVPVTITPAPRRPHRHGGRGTRRTSPLETADVVAAHYYGNTSHMVDGKHGYRGNGHLAHPEGLYPHWQASPWVSERFLQMHQGEVVVREPGLYLVYAQIYYVDEHDMNGFYIKQNGKELAQCTTMTHTERKLEKRNTCWTGTLAALADGDRMSVKDIETNRNTLFSQGKSFFGMIKLADLNTKQQHHAHSIIK